MKRLILGMAVCTIGMSVIGCSNTVEGAKKDMEKAEPEVARATKNATTVVRHAAKNATAALILTPKVKSAINADAQLKDSRNRIDVDSKDNVVHLRGHVIRAELKMRAGKIAQKVLNEGHSTDRLSNELAVKR